MRAGLLLFRTALAGALSLGVVAVQGQTAPTPPTQPSVGEPAVPRLTLTVGRSRVLTTDFDITRVSITNPAVADVTVVDTRELLIDGKGPGTVSLIMWGPATRVQYDIVVDPGVSGLQRQIQTIFPGEEITASETAEAVILTGRASNNTVMLRVGELAEAMVPKAKVINLLQLPGGNGSQQVMLQVRVAEVNRHALSDLGTALFTGGVGYKDVIARGTTQQFAAPGFDNLRAEYVDGKLVSSAGQNTFSDFLNLFLFSNKYDVGILVKALQTNGNLQSLAEPNLVAYNGQEASFLAGGELPVPLVQGNTGQVSIQYKEFGVRLTFKPTIAGDVIRLKVKPEVSSLDFANGVSLGGFRVPAIITRRAETDVELRDGQSFAIAGLLNNVAQETKQSVPLLSKLPIIGHLFKSKATSQDRTELMVLVTPHLVGPLNPDEVPPLPTMPDKFLPPCSKPPCDVVPVKKGSGG
ncbi:MAG: type II and III secretion system protein family protein [Vicinamibacterales bacterium]